jgi:acetylornithine deacetylase/succinyl-diaminopimelate desuccinylase-like protein
MRSVVNLIVRHRFGDGGPTIALNAHGDVVPPGEGWTRPPYEGVDRGRAHVRARRRGVEVGHRDLHVRARGAEGGRARRRAPARHGRAALHLRRGARRARGPGWLLERGLTKPDYAIAASFSYAIVTAHNGALQLEVVVHGKAAHGAMPKTGVDALRAANAMIAALYAEADGLEATKSSVPASTARR